MATLLKNKVKLALVKVAEEYDFSIDIVEAILKDKKITTRFTLPNMKLPQRKWRGSLAGSETDNFIDRCIVNYENGLRGAGYVNQTILHIKYNMPSTFGYPSTKKQFIDYIKENTSFKKNGGKYKDLNKMDKLQLLSFVVHSPLCD